LTPFVGIVGLAPFVGVIVLCGGWTMEEQNFGGWLPKMEVAETLGISERTLERLIQQKRIRRAYRRVPGRKPVAVLHPEDVKALQRETVTAAPASSVEDAESAVMPRPTP
jgi:excisionase family DNA binding protein